MGSKAIVFLGLMFLALLISSEVAARELAETSNTVETSKETGTTGADYGIPTYGDPVGGYVGYTPPSPYGGNPGGGYGGGRDGYGGGKPDAEPQVAKPHN